MKSSSTKATEKVNRLIRDKHTHTHTDTEREREREREMY